MAHLLIMGPGRERLVPIEKPRTLLGRSGESDVVLADVQASSTHCRIEQMGDDFRIDDLESANGTWLNGQRVKSHRLQPGDVIGVGQTEILFEAAVAKTKTRRLTPFQRTLREVERAFEKLVKVATAREMSRAYMRLRETASPLAEALDDPEKERLRHLVSWIRRLTNERDHSKLLSLMLESVVELTGAERGFLLLREKSGTRIAAEHNFDGEALRKPTYRVARAVAERVAGSGRAIVSMNGAEDPQLKALGDTGVFHLRSVVGVPIRAGRRILGALYLDNRFERGVFRPDDLPFLMSFADQAAVALENARLHEEATSARAEIEDLNGILRGRVEQQEAELHEVTTLYAQASADARTKYSYDNIVGKSPVMRELFFLLDRVTDSDVPVHVKGESGAGKELAARAIHFNGPRNKNTFVSENCAAIPESLFESELFGHMRGSFTGATTDKKGLFQLADGGTLFLDEITEMPLSMQAKLLRVLQERELRPVGAKSTVKIDVRILTASNRDLAEQVRRGAFREDLYHRIHVIDVEVPPLRRRREDVPALVEFFLKRIAERRSEPQREISPAAIELLSKYGWPGNVRELENEMERAHALTDERIEPESLSDALRSGAAQNSDSLKGASLKDAVREATRKIERSLITTALRDERGNKSAVSRRLGISRPTLDAKMESLKIPRYPA
ncbi:MAG: sigma 54-interacting transcriptional regulator [Planctomycetota bacterium]